MDRKFLISAAGGAAALFGSGSALASSTVFDNNSEVRMARVTTAGDEGVSKSDIAKAERTVTNAEGKVARFESAIGTSVKRNAAAAVAAIEKAEAAVSVIVSTAEYSALKKRLDEVKVRYEVRQEKASSKAAEGADAAARLDALKSSGELAEDAKLLDGMRISIADPSRYTFGSALYGKYGSPADLDQLVEDARYWNENRAVFEQIAEKYESLGPGLFFRATGAAASIRYIRERWPQTEANMTRFKSEAPGELDEALNAALSIAQASLDKGRFDAFTGLNSKMRFAMIKPEGITRVYEVLPGVSKTAASQMRHQYEEGVARINKVKEQARDKIIAENRMEPNAYSGANPSAIIDIALRGFKDIHGKQSIIEVRLPEGQWTRHRGWRWSPVDKAYSYFDYSTIEAYILEKSSSTIATIWRVTVHKKHLESDALIADPASRERHAPTPDQQVLISNL